MARRLPNSDVGSQSATNSQSDVMSFKSETVATNQNSVLRAVSDATLRVNGVLTCVNAATSPLITEESAHQTDAGESSNSSGPDERRLEHGDSPRSIIITAPVDSVEMPSRTCSPRVQIREVMSDDIFEFGSSNRCSAASKESIEVPLVEALQSLTLISRSKNRSNLSGMSCPIDDKSSHLTDESETLYELPDQTAFDNKSFMRVHNRESSNLANVHDQYYLEEILGEGAYGSVWAARERMHANMTGEKFGRSVAIKKVPSLKRLSITSSLGADIFREISVLKTVDHPSVARLFEVFQDNKNMYLILEKCEGGELLDRIMHHTLFEEEEALRIMRQVTSALAYCHRRGIVHRDIKPENILFVTEDSDVVKLVDFGLALGSSDQTSQNRTGTEIYSAPELHQAVPNITKKADMWAVGCVLYAMLSGQVPFSGNNALQALKQGTFAPMEGGVWDNVSEECKDAIRGLLRPNPLERFSAEDMLQCSWFAGSAQQRLETVCGNEHLEEHMTQLRAFVDKSLFRRVCLSVVARHMEWTQCERFYEMFCSMDVDGDGMISMADWQLVWDATVSGDELEAKAVFAALNLSQTGGIEFTEYLAACVDLSVMDKESVLWSAFSHFGASAEGTLKFSALESSVKRALPHDSIDLVASVDEEFSSMSDIGIRFQEFKLMLREGIRGSDDVTTECDDSEDDDGLSPLGGVNSSFRCVTWNDEVEHREQQMSLLDVPNNRDSEAPTMDRSEQSRTTIQTIITSHDGTDLNAPSPRIPSLAFRSPMASHIHHGDASPLLRGAQDSPLIKCITPHSQGAAGSGPFARTVSTPLIDQALETRYALENTPTCESPVSASRVSLGSPISAMRGETVITTGPLPLLPITARCASRESLATGSAQNARETPSLGLHLPARSRETTGSGLGLPLPGRSRDTFGGGIMTLPISARGGADTARSSACLSVLPITSRSGGETVMSGAISHIGDAMTPNMSNASGLSLGLPTTRSGVAADNSLSLGLPIDKAAESRQKSLSMRSEAAQHRDTQTGAKTCRSARSARSMVSVKKLRGRSEKCSPTRRRPTVLSSPHSPRSPRTNDNRSRLPFSQSDNNSVDSNFSHVFFPNDTNKGALDDNKLPHRDTLSPCHCGSMKESLHSSRLSSATLAPLSPPPRAHVSSARHENVVQLTRGLMLPEIRSKSGVSMQGCSTRSGVSPRSAVSSSPMASPVTCFHSPNRLAVDPASSILKTNNATNTEGAKQARGDYRVSNSPPTHRKVQISSNRTSFHTIESPRRGSHSNRSSGYSISNRPTEVSKSNSQSATVPSSRPSEWSKTNVTSVSSVGGTCHSDSCTGHDLRAESGKHMASISSLYGGTSNNASASESLQLARVHGGPHRNMLSISSICSCRSEMTEGETVETKGCSERLYSLSDTCSPRAFSARTQEDVTAAREGSNTPPDASKLTLPTGASYSYGNIRGSSGFELSPRRRYKLASQISAIPYLGPPLD